MEQGCRLQDPWVERDLKGHESDPSSEAGCSERKPSQSTGGKMPNAAP